MGAEDGDKVKVHYTGSLEDGQVFDSSREREPFEFTLGEDAVIAGFQKAVEGQEAGDEVEVEIEPDDGYGPHRDDQIFTVPRSQIPDEIDLEPGKYLQAQTPDGPVNVKVLEAGEEEVKLDGNHPLAGENLHFEIEILDVDKPES